ncbi:hypothetical protein PpBr36_05478 [Pyricularia pennisetigena]|uniref:hypothetical protein n=1 Tax=Pyricularia pennisetigena TaxID=1578925 RepID=UPI001152B2B7|nr:hypothetical protein PpBr36_05478 [Pyricularia pennisetigena]TLS26613.1 hypothetical protein PpBr36_05478 [Pyricularia pennisetigena]
MACRTWFDGRTVTRWKYSRQLAYICIDAGYTLATVPIAKILQLAALLAIGTPVLALIPDVANDQPALQGRLPDNGDGDGRVIDGKHIYNPAGPVPSSTRDGKKKITTYPAKPHHGGRVAARSLEAKTKGCTLCKSGEDELDFRKLPGTHINRPTAEIRKNPSKPIEELTSPRDRKTSASFLRRRSGISGRGAGRKACRARRHGSPRRPGGLAQH